MDPSIEIYISKIWQCRFTKEYSKAEELLNEAANLPIARDALNRGELVRVHAQLKRDQGNHEEALVLLNEAVDLLNNKVSLLRQAHLIRHLADIQAELKLYEEARVNYQRSIHIYKEQGNEQSLNFANALRGNAHFFEVTNCHSEAIPFWQQARSIYASFAIAEGVAECDSYLLKNQ